MGQKMFQKRKKKWKPTLTTRNLTISEWSLPIVISGTVTTDDW